MPVPVSVVTGSLGVGKTTAVSRLLAERPGPERWAVLVNEFGAVGLDGAALQAAAASAGGGEDQGVFVREVAGGCMCCVSGAALTPTVATLVRRAKPARLLVEPSGLGHPGGLLDALRGPDLGPALDVRATVCLVDPREVAHDTPLSRSASFCDQVAAADVVVAAKADLCTPEELAAFTRWGAGLFPPKALVSTKPLDCAMLDTPVTAPAAPPHLHDGDHEAPAAAPPRAGPFELPPTPGAPRLLTSSGDEYSSAGWVFCAEDRFDIAKLGKALAELLEAPRVVRLKGIFRTGKEWHMLGADDGELACEPLDPPGQMALRPIAYRRDSRVELIVSAGSGREPSSALAAAAAAGDWAAVGAALVGCLR
mmetsp:Transcript_21721/g.73839  ORF Transcript_21721/g.73839 Transcript_21721/m.73839 type:complete len:367 (+) Transcript_21721:46-1146(+)